MLGFTTPEVTDIAAELSLTTHVPVSMGFTN